MNTSRVRWIGQLEPACQISGEPFNGVMYDAKTPMGWANICQAVFERYDCKTGTGYGQKYVLEDDGFWWKVEG